jgi:hypothetical protein
MYILVLLKRYNIYIYDIVIVVSICVDNILLKMVVFTETCKGWKITNTTFINHTVLWLKSYIQKEAYENAFLSLSVHSLVYSLLIFVYILR